MRVLDGFDDPACTPAVWNRLVPHGTTDVPYLTWEYQRAWWDTLGCGQLLLLAAERANQVVTIAPFYVADRMISFVGSGAGDYLDFVGLVADPDVIQPLLAAGRDRVPDFLGARLYCVPSTSATIDAVRTAADQLGWECYEERRWPAPIIDLAADPERVRAGAGSRRRERYFRNHGQLELHQLHTDRDIGPQLPGFFAQHIARFEMAGGESFFTDPRRCRFFERLTQTSAARGLIRLNRLD